MRHIHKYKTKIKSYVLVYSSKQSCDEKRSWLFRLTRDDRQSSGYEFYDQTDYLFKNYGAHHPPITALELCEMHKALAEMEKTNE